MTPIEQILAEELSTLQAEIIQAHKDAGQYTTGATAASLHHEISGLHGQLIGASYIGVLDRGRAPGKVPYDMRDIILRWAEAKHIAFSSPSDAQRFAYFVSKRIREEGTQLYRDGGRTDILTDPVDRFQERLSKRLVALYNEEIQNLIFLKS